VIGLRSQATRSGSIALRLSQRAASRVLCWAIALASLGASGCGAAAYSVNVVKAARAVERAKQVGAEKHAPFEMTLAQAYLDKAREESAEASYQDAVHFAKLAQSIGEAAAERSRGLSSKGATP